MASSVAIDSRFPDADDEVILTGPWGTISYYTDRARGRLFVFAEQEPDPEGWLLMLAQIEMLTDGQPPVEYMDQDVVVFEFGLRAGY